MGVTIIFLNMREEKKRWVRVIDLPGDEALEAMMTNDFYSTVELPEYFGFTEVLDYARRSVGDKTLAECTVKGASPENIHGVNLEVMTNKDGRYAVRPLTLANPFLYYMLVRDITAPMAWASIKECFDLYAADSISACSIPVIPVIEEGEKPFSFKNAATILNWWKSIEQTSLELSLKYNYMFIADISECFREINPEAISWALARKDTPHETKANARLADKIRTYLRAMQQGRNIGIPQGSALFNLIAELILGYIDMLLAREIARAKKAGDLPENLDYRAIRYVDDYRIFCNDRAALDKISYILQTLFERFNFRMNPSKTRISAELVTDSIKADKLFYIFNTPIEGCRTSVDADGASSVLRLYDFVNLQKHLLFIYEFSRRFPNSGQLVRQLEEFSKRIEKLVDEKKRKAEAKIKRVQLWEEVDLDIEPQPAASVDEPENLLDLVPEDPDDEPDLSFVPEDPDDAPAEHTNVFAGLPKYGYSRRFVESIPPMVAIAVEIARNNLRAANNALRVATLLLEQMPSFEKEKKDQIIRQIYEKLRHVPNSAFLQVWLQNITHDTDDWSGRQVYDMPLCRLVANQPVDIWNNTWLLPSIAKAFPQDSIVDREALAKTHQVITFKAKRQYDEM